MRIDSLLSGKAKPAGVASVMLSKVSTWILIGVLFVLSQFCGEAEESDRSEAFAKAAAGKIIPNQPSVRGDDQDWLFLVRELRQISLGNFWEKPWEEVAANGTNPIPSMVEFHELLSEKGIDLIIVPIPAKASIYPDKLAEGFSANAAPALSPYNGEMRTAGLTVIDLDPLMKTWRTENPERKIYCEQDAHFSPFACEMIASSLASELEGVKQAAGEALGKSAVSTIQIEGDQVKDSPWESEIGSEELTITYAGMKGAGSSTTPLTPSDESPVLLLGDSHTLVFQEGKSAGMHCKGAGLFDHISTSVGYPLDLVGVRGSGLMQARKQLFYKAVEIDAYWEKKEVVIWVFSVREFTQSVDKIISVPLER